IHVHLIKIYAPPDFMSAPSPANICDILVIVVTPVIGHEVLSRSVGAINVVRETETRPAALKTPWAISARDPKDVQTDISAETRMFRGGVQVHPAEVSIQNEMRSNQISSSHRNVVCTSAATARIAEGRDGTALQGRPKHGRVVGREMQHT